MLTESVNLKTIKRFRVRTAIVCHLYIRKKGNQYLFLGEFQPQRVVLIFSTVEKDFSQQTFHFSTIREGL